MTRDHDRVTGGLVRIDGEDWYRIDGVEHLDPFLMTVVSDSDLWMFVSSAGPLTAGRIDADRALLPYETDDRLHRAVGLSGGVTVIARVVGGLREVWQPYAHRIDPGCRRSLRKHVLGNALVLEEEHAGWGLVFRTTWEPSRAHGWVRTSELEDLTGEGGAFEVLDGLVDVMPAGVDAATEQLTSNLVDAYKRSETGRWGTLAVYTLESLITDRAEPAESLSATIVWSAGLEGAEIHLDERVVDDVHAGRGRTPTGLLTGRRGAYLLRGLVEVPAGDRASWMLVADTGLGQAAVVAIARLADEPDPRKLVADDVRTGAERLATLLGGADAFQRTADPVADAHHLSNVLFNSMRGGVFPYGYEVPVADLVEFLADRNTEVHARHAGTLEARVPSIGLDELHALADASRDPDLIRLVLEYLPLTFSRRHGDPSRPWNRFSIRLTNDDGDELLNYEGNWRDIFQNWEALLRSYPSYLPHVVAKFVNASTADGHNPYRVSRDGIDWEVPDPHDPWSNIGYWGDHQIVYLHRLLRSWQSFDPDGPVGWLHRPLFTYADVPYRIAGHERMVRDPRRTIDFDHAAAAAVDERVARLGADGRLVVTGDEVVHVTLGEKLLVPALAKLSSYVAGGGIWMNTQRPEWNDANNALAGHGLSMVTLYQLEAYLRDVRHLLRAGGDRMELSRPISAWLAEVGEALAAHQPTAAVTDASARRRLLDALGLAGQRHRERIAGGFDATPASVERGVVDTLLARALEHLRASIATARRSDGLYHAYNLVAFPCDDVAEVTHLDPMLEGQVAVLGTSALDAEDVVELVDALFASPLYRADQRSLMLYPPAARAAFLDRNTLPAGFLDRHPELAPLVGPGASGVLQADVTGALHFRPGLENARALATALDEAGVSDAVREEVHAVYEDLFDHHAFTGRSGGMYGYEGIGSIYWHMVSKLLLAVQERYLEAVADDVPEATLARLGEAYRRVRDGLGFRKDPATFGAVPTDCYSHTPAHAGAQQPGMTGQVKEEVITRLGELGLVVDGGILGLGRPMLPDQELWDAGTTRGPSYSCSVCETPIRVLAGDRDLVRVTAADGRISERDGRSLTREESTALFGRTGDLAEVEFVTSARGSG